MNNNAIPYPLPPPTINPNYSPTGAATKHSQTYLFIWRYSACLQCIELTDMRNVIQFLLPPHMLVIVARHVESRVAADGRRVVDSP